MENSILYKLLIHFHLKLMIHLFIHNMKEMV